MHVGGITAGFRKSEPYGSLPGQKDASEPVIAFPHDPVIVTIGADVKAVRRPCRTGNKAWHGWTERQLTVPHKRISAHENSRGSEAPKNIKAI
jgi:hypothetical protein